MGENWTKEGFVAGLETLGESEVRARLSGSVYGPARSEKRILVEQWLSDRAQARAAEDAAIAKSASEAARIAAEESTKQTALAEAANRIAQRANSIAIAALIIAIIAAVATGVIGIQQLQQATSLVAPSSAVSQRP